MGNKRKSIAIVAVAVLLCFCLLFAACNKEETTQETPDTGYDGPYAIRLTAIGSTTIKAGSTVQLRSSVTGTTSKDVTYASDNTAVATVDDRGLVTGVSAGEATITASLVIEPRCQATMKITVEQAAAPTAVTISAADELQWVGQTLQLTASVTPEDAYALVEWSSDNDEVASVDETGLVTFNSEGTITVTAASAMDGAVKDTVVFDVKKGFFRGDLGSPYWDISAQRDDENAHVTLDIDASQAGYHSLYLSDVSATRYYVEGYFEITEQVTAWAWQGVGIGSGLSETSTRYGLFSPRVEGQGNDYNKFIVKDLPNEIWPAITTRSQIWGENGLNNVDWQSGKVKFGLLRDNNDYYYLVNDTLMYMDSSTVYDGIATMPIFVAVDVCAEVTGYSVVTDDEELDAMLASPTFSQLLYASNSEIVEIGEDGSYTFKTSSVQSKDNKAKSIGDTTMLVGDFEVEFDISGLACNAGHTSAFTGISLNLSRYESADNVETFIFGTSANQQGAQGIAGMYSWNYQRAFEDPAAPYYWLESTKAVADPSATHHIKVTRTIVDNVATFRMFIDGEEVVFDKLNNQWAEMTSKYTGAYTLWIAGEYASGQVTNLQIRSGL